ncbi:MAG TPA: phospholipase D-like domain-containing protein, partial [Steroidobacteraceae bacterium]|nr:phospholipase D-like domain-containing protein [Steroidobacteraceae bacterium]
MYIYKSDATGERFRKALLSACERGVRVRILLDYFGSHDLPKDYFIELIKLGVDVRMFNPSRVLRFAFRNHRKLCVADNHVAIVGGFNIGDEYAGDGVHHGWRDLGVRITGPLALELTVSFDRMFIAARMDRAALIVFARGLRPSPPPMDRPALLTSGPGFGGALMRRVLFRDLHSARDVNVVSAYFAPTWSLRRHLSAAARHGSVRLILPGRTDVAVLRLAAQHLYARILKDGALIFEYQPQVLHAKLLVIDDVVYVGSSNLDARSLRLNFELLVRLPITALAAEARQLIATDISRSRLIKPREWQEKSYWWNRIERQLAYWLVTR